jgi:hypothetical protein
VFLGIPKLINLLNGPESRRVALAGGREAGPIMPLGLESMPECGDCRPGLAAISCGRAHGSGAIEGLNEALDAQVTVALSALNLWKPHLSYDLEGAHGREGGHQQAEK